MEYFDHGKVLKEMISVPLGGHDHECKTFLNFERKRYIHDLLLFSDRQLRVGR
jgi:hypothetical protein